MTCSPDTRYRFRVVVAAIAVVLLGVRAAGQQAGATATADQPRASGWTFTPTLVYGGSWDDNVLIHTDGDATAGDYVTVVSPRGSLNYTGRRGQLGLNYDGSFLLYRAFGTLNSYDQHATLFGERQLSKRVSIFARDSAGIVPTTEAVEFVGVPFLRTGSRFNDLRGGLTVAMTKRTSMTAAYTAQWIAFDETGAFAQLLRGGHSQGVNASLRHQVSARMSVVGDYDLQHAAVGPSLDGFDIQNGTVGFEYRLTDLTQVSAGFGISHVAVSGLGPARTGPAWHAGVTRQFRKAGLDLTYSRSFVPSYGFGGTTQNEEAIGRGRLPLTRRLYTQSSLAWRRNEPLTRGDLKLTSWWLTAGAGYGLTPWLRMEGFYNLLKQRIDRPGGSLNRNQVGFLFVMTQPVRIH